MSNNWSVSVMIDGKNILYISQRELSGIDNIDIYSEEIRLAAENLLSFIGRTNDKDAFIEET